MTEEKQMAENRPIRVLGISGSLRRGSFNTAALRAAVELAPAGMSIEPFDLSAVPLYNEDIYEKGFPPAVEELRRRIKEADALLIATPEYNYSVPGVLKNAIDWASRPPDQPFDGKPMAIFGASPTFTGTARAQYHLGQVFIYLNALILNRPEVFITAAHTKIDGRGGSPTRRPANTFAACSKGWSNGPVGSGARPRPGTA
ncbi:MAG: NAD(P)H-dependent oxidoreductase [Gemmataceae bacterium]